MDAGFFRSWMTEAAQVINQQSDALTALDAAIGDGDHGRNMDRGFTAVLAALDEANPETPGDVLRETGRALIAKVGGAAGPLYGTAFRRAGKSLGTEANIGPLELGTALQAAVDGVRELGKATEGDKTMVDALIPAVIDYQNAVAEGASLIDATRAAATAAERGAGSTVPMQARKGRASYLGPRSVGHEDPGAASSALIMRALATIAAGSDE